MTQRDARVLWARLAAVVVSSVSGLYLLAVLVFGALTLTMDWSGIGCFDGDEPACSGPSPSDAGLSAVQASSWLLAALAVSASVGAVVLSFRVRRVRTALVVLALVATSGIVAQVLGARL